MPINDIKKITRIYALKNAIQFNGKANVNSVMGKVVSFLKKDDINPEKILLIITKIVNEVNNIPIEKQIFELSDIAPELLKKEKKMRDFSLPDLPGAVKGKVITRFPPEPNGYLHIGHAKASIIDYEYARIYQGKFILRFDDTNPENVKIEFYDVQKEDLIWLNINWDEEYCTSDNIDTHYKLAEQLIKHRNAYVCKCTPNVIRENRFNKKECNCRTFSSGENIDLWKEMISSSIYGAVLRLKGEMTCANTVMRDPTLFRIIDKEHPLQGYKFRVWPTYDFAGAVEDSISGVTHPFRTKEYELRDECYYILLELLKLRKPNLMEFARLSLEGMPVSKRKIKPLIEKRLVSGYDDIRLPTLRGLKKRGILPDTIKKFVLSQGISKAESTVSFSIVESINRKLIDPITKRYFFVKDPIKLIVQNAPIREKTINFHPNNINLGSRTIKTTNLFYISKEDFEKIKIGDDIRLIDLYNIRIKEKNNKIIAEYSGDDLLPDLIKIQWTTDNFIKMKIFVPGPLFKNDKFNQDSLKKIEGFAENEVLKIQNEDIVQFERFGFVKIENTSDKLIGYYTHK